MHDPPGVGRPESLRDLDPVAQNLVERKRPPRQPPGQRLALQQLHHQEVDVTLPADVVEGADVRVIQARDRPGLAREAGESLGILRHVRRQDLHGDVTPEPGVPRPVDLAHPSRADQVRVTSYGPRRVPRTTASLCVAAAATGSSRRRFASCS